MEPQKEMLLISKEKFVELTRTSIRLSHTVILLCHLLDISGTGKKERTYFLELKPACDCLRLKPAQVRQAVGKGWLKEHIIEGVTLYDLFELALLPEKFTRRTRQRLINKIPTVH